MEELTNIQGGEKQRGAKIARRGIRRKRVVPPLEVPYTRL